MKLLRQMGIILIICYVGEILKTVLRLPLPGNLIGMLLLFILLCTNTIKVDKLKEISDFLLEHLAFFFVPAGVGLMTYMGVLKQNGMIIFAISFIITILVAAVTGGIIQFMKRGAGR